jgi:tetratricopeptide (TPR) repeat protein
MYSAERFIDRAQKMLELQDQQAARAVEEARLAREQAAKAQANRYAGAAWAALERAVEDVGNNSMLKLAWQAQAEERANKALRDLFSSPQYDQLQAILRWASWNPGPLAAEYGYGNLSDKLRTVGDMEKALRDVERSERQEPEDKPEGDK